MQPWATCEGLFAWTRVVVELWAYMVVFVGTREPKNIFEVNKDTQVERCIVRKNVSCVEVLYCV